VVTHQLQVECRTGNVRRSETDVLPTVPRNQPGRDRPNFVFVFIIIVVYYELSKRNWTIKGKNRDKIKTSTCIFGAENKDFDWFRSVSFSDENVCHCFGGFSFSSENTAVFGRKCASWQSAVNLAATIKAHQMEHICNFRHGRRSVGGQGDMSALLFQMEGTPCVGCVLSPPPFFGSRHCL